MNTTREPLFLERESYRRRRLMDAARFLPFLSSFLFLVPVLWAGLSRTTSGLVFLFGVWLLLIVVAGALSRRLAAEERNDRTPDGGG